MNTPPIVLTTDFGTADTYVGVMKGVILNINPMATIIDLTHQIQPQNIRQAAFILSASHRFFPAGAIHVVVVDPGVGTDRRALLVVTPTARFLAPDNGVLSPIIHPPVVPPYRGGTTGGYTPPGDSGRVSVPPSCSAYQLTNHQYWLHPVSDTFHGRDVFAPVAAYLSLGVRPESLGPSVSDLVWQATPEPRRQGDTICGEVIYADHFGNLVTNLPTQLLVGSGFRPDPTQIQVEIKGRYIGRLSRTYYDRGLQDTGEGGHAGPPLLALIGSHGYLEIAVRDGNAAAELGASAGEPVYVRVLASAE